jgi:hypothetical protein
MMHTVPCNIKRKAIIEGEVVEYDACSQYKREPLYGKNIFTYIGKGVIHSIDNVPHKRIKQLHFWRKISER